MSAAWLGNQKVRHVLGAGQSRDHTCHWPGCGNQVPPAMWGCKPHWYALPVKIRNDIWANYRVGQETDGRPSGGYMLAARRAQEWIAENHPPAPRPPEQGALL